MKFRCNQPYFSINYFELGIAPTKEEYIRASFVYRSIKPSDAHFQEYLKEHINYYPSEKELQEL